MTRFEKPLHTVVEDAYAQWADHPMVCEKKNGVFTPTTYGEIISRATRLAEQLLAWGWQGKRIMIFGPNSGYYMMADLAVCAYVGVSVNVNFQTGKDELVSTVSSLGVDAILYDRRMTEVINAVKSEVEGLICFEMQATIDALNAETPTFDLPVKDPEVCSKIVYSSGTTSNPKGVMLSLKNIMFGRASAWRRIKFAPTDKIYLFMPLHHTYANIYHFIYAFVWGWTLYLCSDFSRMEEEILEVQPTVFCAVPMIFNRIYEHHPNDLADAFGKNIRYIYSGGAKFDPAVRKAYKDCGLPMGETYALTEVASSLTIEYLNKDDYESAGDIFEDIDVKIIPAGDGSFGEIAVKGDNVFMGYVNNEELTKSVFTEDGYFLTGDYGCFKNGKLYIIGRKSDTIIGANGENVYPREIEKALKAYSPDITKLQAFLKDEKLHYKIFIRKGSYLDIDSLIAEYNTTVTRKDRILFYEVIYTDMMNLKG